MAAILPKPMMIYQELLNVFQVYIMFKSCCYSVSCSIFQQYPASIPGNNLPSVALLPNSVTSMHTSTSNLVKHYDEWKMTDKIFINRHKRLDLDRTISTYYQCVQCVFSHIFYLKDAVTFSKGKVEPVVLHGKGSSIGHSKIWLGWQNKDLL